MPPEAKSKRAKIKDAQDTSPAFNFSPSRSRRKHVRVRGLHEAVGEPHWYYIQGAGGEESASVTAISRDDSQDPQFCSGRVGLGRKMLRIGWRVGEGGRQP